MTSSASSASSASLPPIEYCLFGDSGKCPRMDFDDVATTDMRTFDEYDSDSNNGSSEYSSSENASNGEEHSNTEAIPPFLPTATNEESGEREDDAYDSLYLGSHWKTAATDDVRHHEIDLTKLRRLCSLGIIDEGSHRGVAWRVLLEYLPTQVSKWSATVRPQRKLYSSLAEKYFDLPFGNSLDGTQLAGNRGPRRDHERTKHPTQHYRGHSSIGDLEDQDVELEERANLSTASKRILNISDRLPPKFRDQWKRSGINLDAKIGHPSFFESSTAAALGMNQLRVPDFYSNTETEEEEGQQLCAFQTLLEDAKLLEEIRKDVVRTHPDLYFFLEPKENLGQRRYGALERILFVWAKLNKGVAYVQGMNEIVGTIYYVLANDHNSEWAKHAEADSYFLFHTLMMDELKDVFCPDMDFTSSTGIQSRMDNMQNLLKTHDPETREHLDECGIDASFYAIRWLTTLLSREFLLPDTIRLWDSMFASSHKENFFRYVCGTMVMMVREDLLKGDFSTCMKLLQSYPPRTDVDYLLESSRSLWIYESQITLACHKGGISLHQALQTVRPPPAIIMAFGLRGGVAPKLNANATTGMIATPDSPHQSQIIPEHGLLGRAKRLWNGWGGTHSSNTTNGIEGITTQTLAPVSSPAPVPPSIKPRAWNRGRDNPNSLMASSDSNKEIGLSERTSNDTIATFAANRRPIWNRGGGFEAAESERFANSTTPNRRIIWNRGGKSASSTTSADQNLVE